MSTAAPALAPSIIAKERLITELSRPITPLWKHQQQTVDMALTTPIFFDTSDPGTGKTRSHIETAVRRFAAGEISSVLVVCPKTLMDTAWAADIRTYAPGLAVSLAYAEVRDAAFATQADVYILNVDGVKWLAKKTPGWIKQRFGATPQLIIDESTAYKHHTSDRSKAIRQLAKFFPFRTLMTGTPITSSVTDIWHQMLLLDRGERLGKNYTGFRNSVQTVCIDRDSGRPRWVDKEDVEEVIAYMIRDISIRHQFDEVMDVPENFSRSVLYTLSAKHMRAYKEMEETAWLEREEGAVSAINAAVLRNKLLQIASGAVYTPGEESRSVLVLDTGRYELITDLIEERQQSVVFFNWGHQKDLLTTNASKRGITYAVIDGAVPHKERARIVEGFQAGDYQAVYLHPQTGAHGLTLTKGRTTIWSSPRDEPDFLKQGIHRVYRGGQTETTENILISGDGTIEQLAYEKLNGKYARMVNLLDILREKNDAPGSDQIAAIPFDGRAVA